MSWYLSGTVKKKHSITMYQGRPDMNRNSRANSNAWREGFSALISVARSAINAATSNDPLAVASIADQVNKLCALKRPNARNCFLSAMPTRAGDAVNVMIDHRPRKHAKVSKPREFDTIGFPGYLLMHSIGMTCSFHILSKGLYYLRLEAPRECRADCRTGLRVFLSRVELNVGPGEDAPFAGDDHHSYRRADLKTAKSRSYLPRSKYGREQVIELAMIMFARVFSEGNESLSKEGFGDLLRELFAAADAYHGARA